MARISAAPGAAWPRNRGRSMAVSFFKETKIGAYLLKQRLAGRERYPLVLMLEPLFRCNLACVGCGKIDYPDPILNQRLSVQDCLDAVDECGAPDGRDPGRRTADPSRNRRDRRGHRRAQEVRLAVHQRAAARKEAAPVQAFALSVLHRPSRRPQGASRSLGIAERRVRHRGARRSRRRRPEASRSMSTPPSSTAIRPKTSPRFWTPCGTSASAWRSRPATPTSARPTRAISSIAARPRSCSAGFSR